MVQLPFDALFYVWGSQCPVPAACAHARVAAQAGQRIELLARQKSIVARLLACPEFVFTHELGDHIKVLPNHLQEFVELVYSAISDLDISPGLLRITLFLHLPGDASKVKLFGKRVKLLL